MFKKHNLRGILSTYYDGRILNALKHACSEVFSDYDSRLQVIINR